MLSVFHVRPLKLLSIVTVSPAGKRPTYLYGMLGMHYIYLNNKILPLVIHAGYEGGDIALEIHTTRVSR